MVSQNSEFTRKLRAAVRAKIEEYGIDVDDELPDYVMIMVGNKKDKTRMKADLKLFLGDNTTSFVEWLFGFFQKVKQQSTSGSSLPSVLNETTDKVTQIKEQPKKGNDLFFGKTEKVKTFSKAKPIESPNRKEKKESLKTSKREKHTKSSKRAHSPRNEIKRTEKKQHLQPRKKRYSSDDEVEEKTSSPPPSLRKSKIEPVTNTTPAPAPPSTTFAVPRAVLRSVIVHPQIQQLNLLNAAPRILPPARSPSPLPSVDSPQFNIEYPQEDEGTGADQSCVNLESNDDKDVFTQESIEEEKQDLEEGQTTVVMERPHNREVVVPKSKRRVLELQSSRIFQRAITCAQVHNVGSNTRNAIIETKEAAEIDKSEIEETESKLEKGSSAVNQLSMPRPSAIRDKTLKNCKGVAKVFAKAIQETKIQSEKLSNVQNRVVERRAVKRVVCLDEHSNLEMTGNNDFLENKRIRIEMEQSSDSITINDNDNEDEDDSILLVNLGKKSTIRSICKEKKEYKKPKFGLEMLKEHIKGSIEKTAKTSEVHEDNKIEEVKKVVKKNVLKENEKVTEQNIAKEEVIVENIIIKEKQDEIIVKEEDNKKIELSIDSTQQHDIRKIREFVVNLPSESKSPNIVPLWDGCISIDDISSTDDEAEIDAVLEEQHNLKKMALEREKELKGRELPPTSALSRPLVHKRDAVLSLQEALMSPTTTGNVSDLLQQSIQQQILASSSSIQQQQSNNNNITRPYATVAPCQITTPTYTAAVSTETLAQQVQQNAIMTLVSQIAASVNTQNQRMSIQPIYKKPSSSFGYRTFSKTYSPAINNKQIHPFQNKAISQNQPILMQLRERHRQITKLYSDMLEEQLLLLAQIQKMSLNPNNSEKIKTLMFRSKTIEKNAQELKKQLEVLSASFVENVKK